METVLNIGTLILSAYSVLVCYRVVYDQGIGIEELERARK